MIASCITRGEDIKNRCLSELFTTPQNGIHYNLIFKVVSQLSEVAFETQIYAHEKRSFLKVCRSVFLTWHCILSAESTTVFFADFAHWVGSLLGLTTR